MTISVWADVGGTFTDCFVSKGSSSNQTKVLSSGIVPAAVDQVVDNTTLQLDSFPGCEIDQFWVGASLFGLRPNGRRAELGKIVSQHGRTIGLAPSPDLRRELMVESIAVELDANLEAPVLAARLLLSTPLSDPLPAIDVRLGTTRGTNALLTRRGTRTALLVTEGFGDLLRIGEQDRPELFALSVEKTQPLTDHVIEVRERLDASGNVLLPIDRDRLRQDLQQAIESGIRSIAICLLHSHVNPEHEHVAEQVAFDLGLTEISRSSEVAPLIKLVSRAETTTLDAYLNPILSSYMSDVWDQFGGKGRCNLRLMTSAGNLVTPAGFRGRDSILSGPAGGVVALGHVARLAGAGSVIGLDMGGTSTDVSRFEGQVGRRYESRVAGIRVMTPMMDIETVAAGGGSICDSIDGRLTVGPASAGAEPGPACYGRGGPLTVTDINLLLGRIPANRFPFPLHQQAALDRIEAIRQRLDSSHHFESMESLAEGFLDIAVTHMAEAVRTVTTAQGSDPRDMALVGFGGAAGQHLCRVAKALGIGRVLDHPDSAMLSALGMGLADIGRVVSRGVYQPLADLSDDSIAEIVLQLKNEASQILASEEDCIGEPEFQIECEVRYMGTESPLTVVLDSKTSMSDRFHEAHRHTFGYSQPDRELQLVVVRCEATLPSAEANRSVTSSEQEEFKPPLHPESISIWHDSSWIDCVVVDRESLRQGDQVKAPAMIVSPHSTLIVEPGWSASVIEEGIISMQPNTGATAIDRNSIAALGGIIQHRAATDSDPVLLEVVARRLQGIADAMGEVLRRTSISVNVKERRDYSCAVFRGDGSLVANAPHVPVHLGAMGHTVRRIRNVYPQMSPGDCYLSNDPFSGGSHLPDVTSVTPVFCDLTSRGTPDFFVASRAHHAEIGGITPGSMPPNATSLAEEGVLIRDFALQRDDVSHRDELRQLLSSGPYPSRCVEENLADIAAQQAAGTHGARALRELANVYSIAFVDSMMKRLLDVSGDAMQRWIRSLAATPMRFEDSLDDGTPIAVVLQRSRDQLKIEFETGPVHPNGFNATPAIVTAAVLYVLRCVCGSNLPLCDGVLRDVEILIPPGLLDPPRHDDPAQCAAVVAGNVETSQRIVDVLLGALQVAAASQGTMNNVLIGDSTFGYYETIGGGSGATAEQRGADAIHTHMTNTRITDPEVLESRLPIRLWQFSIRKASGGAGANRGGHGIVREFEFLKPLVVSLITSRRTKPPYGANGGGAGTCGLNRLVRHDVESQLPSTATVEVEAGQRLILCTPGGGGWGPPPTSK